MLLAVLLVGGCGTGQQRGGLSVTAIEVKRDGDVVVIEPKLELRLSRPVIEALRNGVPVVILLEARLQRERRWLWPATEIERQRRYEFTYHSLGDQYLVKRDAEPARAFPSREAALAAVENPETWPLKVAPSTGGRLRAGVRVRIDLHALPAPMRLIALFNPGWRIGSDWHSQALAP